MIQIKSLNALDRTTQTQVIHIWHRSVTESHRFLTPEAILQIKQNLPDYLTQVDQLFGIFVNQTLSGFIGIEGNKIEMLFIDPIHQSHGLGRKLIEFARKEFHIKYVDVNEQNPDALLFYEHLGFKIMSRSETDDAGEPYPILNLVYQESPSKNA